MNIYKLPYFGEIDLDEPAEYYDVDIEFEGNTIQLDINTESESVGKHLMDIVKKFLESLTSYKVKAKAAILANFESGGMVKEYIEHHLEIIDEDELEIILRNANHKLSKEQQLLSLIHFVRLGFYLDSEEAFAVMDYTIGRDITQYLVVTFFNNSGEITSITMES